MLVILRDACSPYEHAKLIAYGASLIAERQSEALVRGAKPRRRYLMPASWKFAR